MSAEQADGCGVGCAAPVKNITPLRGYTSSVKNQRFLPASPQGEALGAPAPVQLIEFAGVILWNGLIFSDWHL